MPRPKTKPEPSKGERLKLAQLCDKAIERLLESEHRKKMGLRPHQVADEVKRTHPRLMERFGTRMADAYLVIVASDRLRAGEATLRAARTATLVLPGIDETILANLPPLITIGRDKEKSHKPITHATVGELRLDVGDELVLGRVPRRLERPAGLLAEAYFFFAKARSISSPAFL